MVPFSPEWVDAYYTAILKHTPRYREMIQEMDADKHGSMLEWIDGEFNRDTPLLKLDRWLGYIQRFVIDHGATTVQAERDATRGDFRPLDFM